MQLRFDLFIHVVALDVAFVKVLWIMYAIKHYNSGPFVVSGCVFVNIIVSDNVCACSAVHKRKHVV